jgi:hypothetical protein
MPGACIEGKRSAGRIADYARTALRSKRDQLEMALEGALSEHQKALLSRLMRQLNAQETEVADLTGAIESRAVVWEEIIGRLVEIPGIERVSAWTILAEIGTDMNVFSDSRHLASRAAGLSRQPGERRQAHEWQDAPGQRLSAPHSVPGGMGRHPQEGILQGSDLSPGTRPARASESDYGAGAPICSP